MKVYLLSIEELQNGIVSQEECLARLDSHRREKAMRMKVPHARNLSVGAGLLLQLAFVLDEGSAADEAVGTKTPGRKAAGREAAGREDIGKIRTLSMTQLLELLRDVTLPREPVYTYDAKGKPQFADHLGGAHSFPCFNLSHSGDYVCCAFSEKEVGIDIQKKAKMRDFRVAEKWFSGREKAALLACGDNTRKEDCFYGIWTKKESYAKLTGEGIGTGITVDTMAENAAAEQKVRWLELPAPEGYCMTVCCYTDDQRNGRIDP